MAKEAVKKPAETVKKPAAKPFAPLFEAGNIQWMIIGVVVIVLGLLLMAGGKSTDPNVFNPSEIYSIRRVTIAPILVVGGLVIEIFAIMKKPKAKKA
ncbi:MAG TPA: DUF3098 domain-containing protein [Dinghuibacter sp.]|jgi:hypothetical protein|uniref:DUF3098 domain-containing protein n=1 Tax=Dinghuibacter sp. TaxID=2024697 RepID=UPI002CD30BC8|nr:DUF3098 domain-containing protein [Dinghuibacter sp.]HTJ13512.1 DUF3098 domain-containing protein [Dinghuibacter sp.]